MNMGRNMRAVKVVCFSRCGSYVFACAHDNDHTVIVFDVSSGKPVASDKYGPDPPFDIDSCDGSYSFGICGTRKGNYLYSFKDGVLDKKKGLFGSTEMTEMASIAFFDKGDKFLTGAVSGNIYIWNGN